MTDAARQIEIIYDGQCPACKAYFRLQKLRSSGMDVHMTDGRLAPDLVAALVEQGINLNNDFVLRIDGRQYAGAEAARLLASLGEVNTPFRKLNRELFRSLAGGLAIYAMMRIARRILLIVLGRKPLGRFPIHRQSKELSHAK